MLFYRLLTDHLEEMLPIRLHHAVGQGDRTLQPTVPPPARGVPRPNHPEDVELSLRNYRLPGDDVDLLVATDAEGIRWEPGRVSGAGEPASSVRPGRQPGECC
jgi:malate dehydrogenase (oxaloacetate-decarboxylating)